MAGRLDFFRAFARQQQRQQGQLLAYPCDNDAGEDGDEYQQEVNDDDAFGCHNDAACKAQPVNDIHPEGVDKVDDEGID